MNIKRTDGTSRVLFVVTPPPGTNYASNTTITTITITVTSTIILLRPTRAQNLLLFHVVRLGYSKLILSPSFPRHT